MSNHNAFNRAADGAGRRCSTTADGPFSDLPTLVGSQRQVAWDVDIRRKAISTFLSSLARVDPAALDESEVMWNDLLGRVTAQWWIENTGRDFRACSLMGRGLPAEATVKPAPPTRDTCGSTDAICAAFPIRVRHLYDNDERRPVCGAVAFDGRG